MKKIGISLLSFFALQPCFAQIQKTAVVEHFTNSNCSICASNNPTFYGILATQPNVLHITFHPSSPYASCVFSQANKPENDARTNYYGVFGGTPKFIVNGVVGSVANMATLLTNASSEMSNYSLKLTQEFIGLDSVKVSVVVKKVATDTLSSASIFVGAFQDTVNQTTGNGESIHHDVFRKGLTNMTGDVILLPTNVNDSIIIDYGYKIASTWIKSRMKSIAILQKTDTKAVLQSDQSVNIITQIPSSIKSFSKTEPKLFPNPSNGVLQLKDWQNFMEYSITSLDGRLISKQLILSSVIDIQNLYSGVYIIQLSGKDGKYFEKMTIKTK